MFSLFGACCADGPAGDSEAPPAAQVEEELKRRTVWAGGIPNNMVGGQGASDGILNINANRNITSLFSEFGEISNSTVRVKPGANKSWALVTFKTAEAAADCLEAGVTVMGAEYEQLALTVQAVDVEGELAKKGESSGYLQLLAKHHHKECYPDVQSDTLWIGGLPEDFVGADEAVANELVATLCKPYGSVVATSVRLKPGKRFGSWALVTYKGFEAVERAAEAGMRLPRNGVRAEVELRVLPADVEKELQKGTTGYLAHTARRHEKEVEAAKKLLRGWWDQGNQGKAIPRSLKRFRACDIKTANLSSGGNGTDLVDQRLLTQSGSFEAGPPQYGA